MPRQCVLLPGSWRPTRGNYLQANVDETRVAHTLCQTRDDREAIATTPCSPRRASVGFSRRASRLSVRADRPEGDVSPGSDTSRPRAWGPPRSTVGARRHRGPEGRLSQMLAG